MVVYVPSLISLKDMSVLSIGMWCTPKAKTLKAPFRTRWRTDAKWWRQFIEATLFSRHLYFIIRCLTSVYLVRGMASMMRNTSVWCGAAVSHRIWKSTHYSTFHIFHWQHFFSAWLSPSHISINHIKANGISNCIRPSKPRNSKSHSVIQVYTP